jgi:Ca2+-binding EF-hand superfamily protein
MKNVLGGIENDEVDYLFKQLDSDGDDIISKEEFIEYLINN